MPIARYKITFFIFFLILVVGFAVWMNLGSTEPSDIGVASAVQFSGERYGNSEFNFSFEKPEGYNIGEFEEGDSYVVLAQPKEGQTGFQIIITLLGAEDTEITKDIIVSEIPGIKIENDKTFSIGRSKGLIFESDNSAFNGTSAEAWFMYKGNLYQISGYGDSMSAIEQILKTWEWN